MHTSITLDPNLHISYFDWGAHVSGGCTKGDFKYVANSSDNCEIFTIDSEGLLGYFTSAVVDSNV